MKTILFRLAVISVLIGMLAGCMATRSPITGIYNGPAEKNQEPAKVSVFFLFRNMTQEHGMDSIPKLKDHGIKDFNNLFRDSLSQLGNIARYTTFIESPNDVNNPKRRDELAGFRNSHDYTLEITFLEESSFRQQMLSGTVTLISLTLIPMPYSWDYTISANLLDKKGSLVRSYQRKATLDNWVQAALIFAYPFYPLEGKREQIVAESLHDIFRQVEAEKVLK